jgi:hypothetical protein
MERGIVNIRLSIWIGPLLSKMAVGFTYAFKEENVAL